jgi:hypothetical protein
MQNWYVFIVKYHVTGLLHAEVARSRCPIINSAECAVLSCLGPFPSPYNANTVASRLNALLDYQEGAYCEEAHASYEDLLEKEVHNGTFEK